VQRSILVPITVERDQLMSQSSTGLSQEERAGSVAARPAKLPDAYRTRREAADYLRSRGYPISFSTCAHPRQGRLAHNA
jgi:hypothetical protein